MFAHIKRSLAVAGVAMLGATATAHAANSPMGVWIDHTGRGAVEIKDCGDGKLCGHVVWVQDTADAKGCGLQILGAVAPVGAGQWDNGWIYSPERKQKFTVEVTPLDGERLRVKGYKGIKLLSKTMIWNRAPSDLQRCDKSQTTALSADPAPAAAPKADATPKLSAKPRRAVEGDSAIKEEPKASAARIAKRSSESEQLEAERFQVAPDDGEQAEARGDDSQAQPADPQAGSGGAEDKPRRRGIAGLLQEYGMEDGIDVGDGYGLDVEKGDAGEKTCLLKVPFVTVQLPCED